MRCKAGDLAVVTNAACLPKNIGRIVCVERIATAEELADMEIMDNCAIWLLSGSTLVVKNIETGVETEIPFAPDEVLQPIRPAPEQITRDEEIAA